MKNLISHIRGTLLEIFRNSPLPHLQQISRQCSRLIKACRHSMGKCAYFRAKRRRTPEGSHKKMLFILSYCFRKMTVFDSQPFLPDHCSKRSVSRAGEGLFPAHQSRLDVPIRFRNRIDMQLRVCPCQYGFGQQSAREPRFHTAQQRFKRTDFHKVA